VEIPIICLEGTAYDCSPFAAPGIDSHGKHFVGDYHGDSTRL